MNAEEADHRCASDVRGIRITRFRALLASGLVLGVGSVATLAAWNDSEHASAELTAGEFALLGSTDGEEYFDHGQDSPAQLVFDVDAADLTPGSAVYALFSVRTGPESLGGTLELFADQEANGTGLGPYLSYGVTHISGTTCTAETYAGGGEVVAPDSGLTADGTRTLDLAAGGEQPVNYCFRIALPQDTPDEAQGQGVNVSWEFRGTSVGSG